MWKRLDKNELQIGMKVKIANQQAIGWGGKSLYTPKFAAGNNGIILRINKCSVTVDIGDGGNPIRCDFKDVGVEM